MHNAGRGSRCCSCRAIPTTPLCITGFWTRERSSSRSRSVPTSWPPKSGTCSWRRAALREPNEPQGQLPVTLAEENRQLVADPMQRLVKSGGRLVKHVRYYWLMLAESHLTRRLFGSIVAAEGGPAGVSRMLCGAGKSKLGEGGGAERRLTNPIKPGASKFLRSRRSRSRPVRGPLEPLAMERNKRNS